MRQLREGGASRSYGIQCARLAGLPRHVVQRASRLLKRFEKHAPRNEREQLSLFGAVGAPDASEPDETASDPAVLAVLDYAKQLDPDAMSPRDALDALYALRDLLPED